MKYIISCLISIATGNQILQSGYREWVESHLKTHSSQPILDQFISSSAQQYGSALRFWLYQERR